MSGSGLQFVPITEVKESPNNPRRRFNEQKMQDLIQSVKEKGILVPLLVRPMDGKDKSEKDLAYEILAGARRYRAAKTIKIAEIPVIIKDVDDNEALEIQIFENEQRDDVHPLEQAGGYKQLMDRNYTVPAIAAKLGCSESHVYKRLKLLDLIEPAQEAFLDDRITAEHAVLIARLQPKDQEKAFAQCFDKYRADELISAKSLADWIEFEIHLDLRGAPFKLGDELLLPAAGSCINCPKRTGFNAHLFPDIRKKDTCTDGACFKKKLQAHINQTIAQQEEKGKELLKVSTDWSGKKNGPLPRGQYQVIPGKEDSCEHARKAIIVSGREGKGKVITVCADPDCKIHKKQTQSSQGHSQEDYQKQQKAREEKAKKEQQIRERIFIQISEKAKDSDWIQDDWRLMAFTLIESIPGYGEKMLFAAKHRGFQDRDYGKAKKHLKTLAGSMKIENLCPFLIELCLAQYIPVGFYDDPKRPELFLRAAARFKVDVKAIEKEIAKESRAEQKPIPKKTPKKETKAGKKKTPADSPNLSCDNQCDSCNRNDCPVKG